MSDGHIQWPSTRRTGAFSLILCGDLIRAVQRESEIAVAHHWGVGPVQVWKWRRALGVPRMTNGTRRLVMEIAVETLTPEVRAMAQEAMKSPEVRAKLSALRAGRPLHPNAIAAQRAAVRRPKSADYKRAVSERSRTMWKNREKYHLPPSHQWSEQEIALLGTDSDPKIARRLGLSNYAVFDKRRSLGIPRPPQRWTEAEIGLLGTASDGEVARRIGKKASTVKFKREQLGIPPSLARWTKEQIALLGTASDSIVARKLRKNEAAVKRKRIVVGIPPFVARWTEEETALLGRGPDDAVAAVLGRTLEAVRLHRTRLSIPAYHLK